MTVPILGADYVSLRREHAEILNEVLGAAFQKAMHEDAMQAAKNLGEVQQSPLTSVIAKAGGMLQSYLNGEDVALEVGVSA